MNGKWKKKSFGYMLETNWVLFFWAWEECFYSCPVNWSSIIVTDLCNVRPRLFLMPNRWFIATLISNHTHASSSLLPHFLFNGLTCNRQPRESWQSPQNKIQMKLNIRCLGAKKMLLLLYRKEKKVCLYTYIFHDEELTHCLLNHYTLWSSDSVYWWK